MTNDMEVDVLEERQAGQAADENRRRRREQRDPVGGDLLAQMRVMMGEVIKKETAETLEKVCPIEKTVEAHETRLQDHDRKFQDLESAVTRAQDRELGC